MTTAFLEAAKEHLITPKQEEQTFHATEEMTKFYADRQEAYTQQDHDTIDILNKKIKQATYDNNKQRKITSLQKQKWIDIKNTKKAHMPKFTKLKNTEGKLVTSKERPQVLADYFEKIQWNYEQHKLEHQNIQIPHQNNQHQEHTPTRVNAHNTSTPKAPHKQQTQNTPSTINHTLKETHLQDKEAPYHTNGISTIINKARQLIKPKLFDTPAPIKILPFDTPDLEHAISRIKKSEGAI